MNFRDPAPDPASSGDRICGLVAYLVHDADAARAAQEVIAAHPGVTPGPPAPHSLPLVLESTDARTERDTIRWLEALPGVRLVTVAYAWYGEPQPQPEAAS